MTNILAIDQGTTSSRAILFDGQMRIAATAQEEFDQHYPASGWVEHDPADLWATTAGTCREVIERGGIRTADIAAIAGRASRCTARSSGRTGARPTPAAACARPATRR